jgi:hypothetical protein
MCWLSVIVSPGFLRDRRAIGDRAGYGKAPNMNNQAGHAGGWIRSGTGEGATRLTEPYYDLVVVGGGINGAGIARDAAGRGYSVLLCEQDDLAAHTSSASTKLIHGGLRYLEHYQFSLVRKALTEREVLLRNAPHIIWPLRFVMPHTGSLRPAASRAMPAPLMPPPTTTRS